MGKTRINKISKTPFGKKHNKTLKQKGGFIPAIIAGAGIALQLYFFKLETERHIRRLNEIKLKQIKDKQKREELKKHKQDLLKMKDEIDTKIGDLEDKSKKISETHEEKINEKIEKINEIINESKVQEEVEKEKSATN
jgi:methyl-accepting chemotaxis protein